MLTVVDLWNHISKEHSGFLIELYKRYREEKDKENFESYLKSIQIMIPEAYKIHSRPFSIRCRCSNGDLKIKIMKEGKFIKLKPEMFGKKGVL